jgi:putative heme-binding domain-containing protein
VRSEVLEALFARADRVGKLLDAIEQKKVNAGQLDPARVLQLRKNPDAAVRKRAEALLKGLASPDRLKVIDAYRPALELKGDAVKGKVVFKTVCATCHRLENEGFQVGPDLLSALTTKTRDALLIDILDPSREVDQRYINYVVSTKAGRTATGIITGEGPTSITLARPQGEKEDILRSDIAEEDGILATGKSLMPDELEKQFPSKELPGKQQDLADLIAYLLSQAKPR